MSGTHLALIGEGDLLGFPAAIKLEMAGGKLAFAGVVHLQNAGIHQLLELTGDALASKAGQHVRELLGTISGDVGVHYSAEFKSISYNGDFLFAAVGKPSGGALLFSFSHDRNRKSDFALTKALNSVAEFFGISDFFLFARTSGNLSASDVAMQLPGKPLADIDKLQKLKQYDVIARGRFDFVQQPSDFTRFIQALFGFKSLDLFIAAAKSGDFETFLVMPSFNTGVVSGQELTVGMALSGKSPSFSMSGTFAFSFIKGMTFTVDCALGIGKISLSAVAVTTKPIPLMGPFKLGTTALQIGYEQSGLTFGLLSTLYVGELAFFGGIMLKYTPPTAVELRLLVLAVKELSLPLLICNLCEMDIPGLGCLDFIKILGFDLKIAQKFSKKCIDERDVTAIIEHFNRQVAAQSLHLKNGQVETQKYGSGLALIDQNNLRCYYIESDGSLKLQAQVYYATVPAPVKMGSYTIHAGIFLCAVIEIFNVKIKVLFSFVKGSGVLAFAQIDPIKIAGVMELTASRQQQDADGAKIPLPQSSVLEQFMDKKSANGLLFFLQADKQNKTFYLSGCLKLFSLFSVDALVKYESGDIAINAQFDLFIFRATLSLRVAYASFTSGGFYFRFTLDTSRLTEALQKVTENINRAIARVQEGINSANRKLTAAQDSVYQLKNQITTLDKKISDCRKAISKARWYQFWIPIAKGCEIAGYEIAKASIYVAIGVAVAAIDVAKKCVNLGGAIAMGALTLVNGIVTAIQSLFFIHKIELEAKASANTTSFSAAIDFTALGKRYTYSTTFEMDGFNSDALSGNINGKMDKDLENLGKKSSRTNYERFAEAELSLDEQKKRIGLGMEQLRAGRAMLDKSMQAYFEEFGTLPEGYEEAEMDYIASLGEVRASLETARRLETLDELDKLVELTESDEEVRTRAGAELKSLKKQMGKLHELCELVHTTIPDIDEMTQDMNEVMRAKREETGQNVCDKVAVCEPCDGNMLNVLDSVEDALTECFPYTRAAGNIYMNLSRERVLLEGLIEARAHYGGQPSEKMRAMRTRANRASSYTERL